MIRRLVGSDLRTGGAIVSRWLAGETMEALAEDYGIDVNTVALVIGAAGDTTPRMSNEIRLRYESESVRFVLGEQRGPRLRQVNFDDGSVGFVPEDEGQS